MNIPAAFVDQLREIFPSDVLALDAATRAAVDVFEPQENGVAALTKRVKESFDPKGVLNPGRMWAGV